jgi:predicted O-methyltransferase YrrM
MTSDGQKRADSWTTGAATSSPQRGFFKRIVGRLLKKTGYTLTRVEPQTNLVCQHIPGWFSIHEAEALYLLAATSSARRMLEIGHFLGRSTSVVCEAIRNTGRAVEFNSYDLGFTNAAEFVAHYKRVHDTTSTEVPPEYERLVFSQGTTTTEIAKQHLGRFGLGEFVNLISGDFTALDRTRYGFIFCDALHDQGEIAVNLQHVISASDDDCIWAFHDMDSANLPHVLSRTDARLIRVTDTLGIFRFRRSSPGG